MASTVEKLENSVVKINVTIDAEEFAKAIVVAYNKHKGSYPVQGFRKGHAPRVVIERMYGKDVFYEDAVDELWQKAFIAAVEEHKLEIVSRPSLQIEHAQEGEALQLAFYCAVYPEVKLGKYKGIELHKVDADVPEAQINSLIQMEQQRLVRYIEVDRPVQMGDRIVFDYKGRVGEEYFAGGEAKDAQLEIGSGRFIPGFEDGLVGMEKEKDGEVLVKFPEEYHAAELSGKDAVFEVRIHSIMEAEYPDIDDDLAKDVSEFDTLEEWKASLRRGLEEDAQHTAMVQMQNEALQIIADNSTFELPAAMVDDQMDNMLENTAHRLEENGIKLEDYCRYMGSTKEQVRESFREEATTRLRNQLVLDEITKQEGITATPEEIEERIRKQAEGAEMSVEEYKKLLGERAEEYMATDIAVDKTLDFIIEHAKIVAKDSSKEKKPAKKTAKKAEEGEEKKPAKKTAKKAEEGEEKKPAKKTAKKAEEGEEKKTAKKTTKKPAAGAAKAESDEKAE